MNGTWLLGAFALAQLLVTMALFVRVGRLEARVDKVLRRRPRKRQPKRAGRPGDVHGSQGS